MDNHDPWWPSPQPTRVERIVAGVCLLFFIALGLSVYNGWQLLGSYDKLAAIVLAGVMYFVVVHRRQSREPTQRQQALYVARSIDNFLDGTGGDWDWDDFTALTLPDVQVDQLRQRASELPLPMEEREKQVLLQLVKQAKAIADMESR